MEAQQSPGTSKIISFSWLAGDASQLGHLCFPSCDISATVRLDWLSYCMVDGLQEGAFQKDKSTCVCKCLPSSACM